MSSEPETESSQEGANRPRLAAVEIGEWPGLGGTVGFDVGERITVLIGKNGAGKSLIMEGLKAAAQNIISGINSTPSPKSFQCHVISDDGPRFMYEFKIDDESDEIDDIEQNERPRRRFAWSEYCQVHGSRDRLWSMADAQLIIQGGAPQAYTYHEGLVAKAVFQEHHSSEFPEQARQLADLFMGLDAVAAGIPRGAVTRQSALLQRIKVRGRYRWEPVVNPENPINVLALRILWMYLVKGHDAGAFDEFVDILRQLGLVREVSIHHYDDSSQGKDSFAAVHFDGVNLGLCSDGTQRIAQIIAQLLSPRTRCLLIEEPETAVHPSLLARLLAILESYSHDRQIIIATHSPQIVDWCKPEDLRLVERSEGQTRVRKLDEKELGRVHDYLTHDGTLSDYVYRQSSE